MTDPELQQSEQSDARQQPQEPVFDADAPAAETGGYAPRPPQDWQDVMDRQQGKSSPAGARRDARLDWPENAPPLKLSGARRSSGGLGKFIIVLLFLGLLGGGGWYSLHHHNLLNPKRLAGMGQFDASSAVAAGNIKPASALPAAIEPAQTPAQTAQAEPAAPVASIASSAADASMGGNPPQMQAGLPAATALQPQLTGSVAALALAETASAAPAGEPAMTLPAVVSEGSAVASALSDPVAAASADSPATLSPSHNSNDQLGELQQRVQRLEDAIVVLQTRQSGQGQPPTAVTADPASKAGQARPPRHVRYRRRVAVQPAAEPASVQQPAPALGPQLLSVDMWDGTPSVVVTSGLPGDTRTRTLRPGDTLNGVTLRTADPATGRATFISGGHPFTLSLSNGG